MEINLRVVSKETRDQGWSLKVQGDEAKRFIRSGMKCQLKPEDGKLQAGVVENLCDAGEFCRIQIQPVPAGLPVQA